MNLTREEFADRLVSEYQQGLIKSMGEMWHRCYQNPNLYGSVMQKLQKGRDVAASEVSGGSNAAAEIASSKIDSSKPEGVQGVRTRSRATKGELKADSEVKSRKKVPKTVRFSDNGVIKGQEVVPRHRCGWYTEQGASCLCFLWKQTQYLLVCLGVCTTRVCLNWWKRLQG